MNPELPESKRLLCELRDRCYTPPPEVPAALPAKVVKFDEFELDCNRYQLVRTGRRIKLERLPMALLVLLLEKEGHLVTREEIVDRLWGPDVFLDTEHGINTAIRKIRNVLRDDPERPRFVQTVTGQGYRFVGRIDFQGGNGAVTNADDAEPHLAAELRVNAPPKATGRKMSGYVVAIAVLLLTAAGLAVAYRKYAQSQRCQTAAMIQSLAVLPLENLSGDPAQDYFADGMTDELITMLAKNSGLRVVSRTSAMQYKGVHRPLPDIARALHVDGVLEGSISRTPQKVHVTVQLVNGVSDTHVWAESYDRSTENSASLSEEISRAVAVKVHSVVKSPKPLTSIRADAHEAVFRGRYYWFLYDMDKAQTYFQQAIDLQPGYAEAWTGLADAYGGHAVFGSGPAAVWMPQAELASRRSLALDDTLPQAHNTAGTLCLFYEWDWGCADRESQRAIALDPTRAEFHRVRTWLYLVLNRNDDAQREDKIANELDPFERPGESGWMLWATRHYDSALEEELFAEKAQPDVATIHDVLSMIYLAKHMYAEWAQEIEKRDQLMNDLESANAVHSAFQGGGFVAAVKIQIRRLKSKSAKQYVSPLEFALLHAMLHEREETLQALEQSFQDRTPFLVYIQTDSTFDFLHNDPRYLALIRKIGLPTEE